MRAAFSFSGNELFWAAIGASTPNICTSIDWISGTADTAAREISEDWFFVVEAIDRRAFESGARIDRFAERAAISFFHHCFGVSGAFDIRTVDVSAIEERFAHSATASIGGEFFSV